MKGNRTKYSFLRYRYTAHSSRVSFWLLESGSTNYLRVWLPAEGGRQRSPSAGDQALPILPAPLPRVSLLLHLDTLPQGEVHI